LRAEYWREYFNLREKTWKQAGENCLGPRKGSIICILDQYSFPTALQPTLSLVHLYWRFLNTHN
jgi:hypothetical protein